MAATFSQLGEIAGHPDFIRRVNVAMNNAALNVYNESSTTPGHQARASFATKVVNGQYNLEAAVYGILTGTAIINEANPAIPGDGIADADISTEVAAAWNVFAGA